VDLSFIQVPVFSLSFELESTDVGEWGMNTPAYFAMDNLEVYNTVGQGELSTSRMSVYPNPMIDVVHVSGNQGTIQLIDVSGNIIQTMNHMDHSVLNVSSLNTGIYFLRLLNDEGVSIQKIVK
jgi:hypothetical protein